MKTAMPLPFFSDGRTVKHYDHGHAYTVARIDPNEKFTPESRPDFAAYIVHAANLYPELVRVLEAIHDFWREGDSPLSPHAWITDSDSVPIADEVAAVLAKAKGE